MGRSGVSCGAAAIEAMREPDGSGRAAHRRPQAAGGGSSSTWEVYVESAWEIAEAINQLLKSLNRRPQIGLSECGKRRMQTKRGGERRAGG
jgi:hypothetical protein